MLSRPLYFAAAKSRPAYKNLMAGTLLNIFLPLLLFKTTGAAGLEPAVTVLETVGLPLTDAPKFTILIPAHIIRRDKFPANK